MHTEEYLQLWLDTYIIPRRKPNTAACYRRAVEALPPDVMRCELAELNGLRLQAAINQQAERYPRAAQLTYTALHVAMNKAKALHLVAFSPMDGVDRPEHSARKTAILTAEQLPVYLSAARSVPSWPLLLVMATCGLRRGEALGLTWAAVDWQTGTLAVTQQRGRVAGRGMQTAALKTGASARVLPLAGPVARELAAWRAAQPVLTRWVLDTTPERLARDHSAALAAAGLPHVTLHGLRHSMATAAAETGAPIKLLQGVLGHSSYKLTADLYADHVRPAAFGPVLDTMARVMQV